MIPGLAQVNLPDGTVLTIVPLLGGRARITRGRGEDGYDEGW